MKKVSYDVKSNVKCPVCDKKIKANLVERKESNDLLCYSCYRIANGPMQTARDIRRDASKRSIKRQHIPLNVIH